jgi:outer membrane immunogenic protein
MRKLLLATTAMVAIAGTAAAADLPIKSAYAPAPAPAPLWTGGYIGAHVGVARMDNSCFVGGTDYSAASCGVEYGAASNRAVDTGITVGVQAGYDWQDRNFVYGVVADWTWTDLDHKRNPSSWSYQAKVDWLASFRGRMGLAVDTTLVYFTGGVAVGKVSGAGGVDGNTYSAINKSQVGWVAGLGVEHKFTASRWSVMAELLYYDLGKVTSGTIAHNNSTYSGEYNFSVTTARVGLNYKF